MKFNWPDWIGTPSQLGLLLAFIGSAIIAYIKIFPKVLEIRMTSQQNLQTQDRERITELVAQIKEIEDRCDERERELMAIIDDLKSKINNEAWQRVQSEISLVSTLLEVVPAQQLKQILEALQKRKIVLPYAEMQYAPTEAGEEE